MSAAFSECDAPLQQQPADLVDHRRSACHPAVAHTVQRLHIQPFIALDRYEPHRGSSHGFGDGLGIDVVVLVGLHVGLDVLRGNQANFVALLAQPATQEMGAATSLHTDESDAQVRSEPQQLRARQPSAYHYLASPVQANKIKNLLPRSMPIVSSSMERLLSHLLYPVGGRGGGLYQLAMNCMYRSL